MIELTQITKKYGDRAAVNNLNLSVPKGEIFGFIGPNGAGKTTTIKIMGGVLQPSYGNVRICGINMEADPENAKGKIGYIPDRPYLYEKLTGMEFLQFMADLYGVNKNGFAKRAESELKRFSLIDWADELIESYSHGMRQRLIFASALLHDPGEAAQARSSLLSPVSVPPFLASQALGYFRFGRSIISGRPGAGSVETRLTRLGRLQR